MVVVNVDTEVDDLVEIVDNVVNEELIKVVMLVNDDEDVVVTTVEVSVDPG